MRGDPTQLGRALMPLGTTKNLQCIRGNPTKWGRALMPLGTTKNLQRMRRWQNEKGVADRRR